MTYIIGVTGTRAATQRLVLSVTDQTASLPVTPPPLHVGPPAELVHPVPVPNQRPATTRPPPGQRRIRTESGGGPDGVTGTDQLTGPQDRTKRLDNGNGLSDRTWPTTRQCDPVDYCHRNGQSTPVPHNCVHRFHPHITALLNSTDLPSPDHHSS